MNPRLPAFLARCASTVYPEAPSKLHTNLTAVQAEEFAKRLAPGAAILDVGCGQGPALKWFTEHGFAPVGITLGEDVAVCRDAGFNVWECDQNDMPDWEGEPFDAVWARHVAEHSPIPFFTLCEYFRVLKPGGWLYLEVPAPETSAVHESNKNHFAVMGARMWYHLLTRAGFVGAETCRELRLALGCGPDTYFAFTVQKPL